MEWGMKGGGGIGFNFTGQAMQVPEREMSLITAWDLPPTPLPFQGWPRIVREINNFMFRETFLYLFRDCDKISREQSSLAQFRDFSFQNVDSKFL
jgi:hypothetical protein